jgi:hypothetical protein
MKNIKAEKLIFSLIPNIFFKGVVGVNIHAKDFLGD